jgi:hypothetical protein
MVVMWRVDTCVCSDYASDIQRCCWWNLRDKDEERQNDEGLNFCSLYVLMR